MKKVILLAGILTLSTSLMAVSAKSSVEGVVDVKAKVVQPLELETRALDYGIILPGEEKWGETNGEVAITGTPGEQIKLEIKTSESGSYTTYKGPTVNYSVELKTGNGSTEQEKMTAQVSLFTGGISGDDAENGIFGLGTEGKVSFAVDGPLTAAQNQKPGEYTGKIYVRAMYN